MDDAVAQPAGICKFQSNLNAGFHLMDIRGLLRFLYQRLRPDKNSPILPSKVRNWIK